MFRKIARKTSRPKKSINSRRSLFKRWWFWTFGPILLLIFLWFGADWAGNTFYPVRQHYNFGTSFSIKRAEGFGLDWKANFSSLLDDLKIRNFRLMSYWDLGEPQRGQYNFTDLDWQVNEAAKRGAKVSLSLGLRQPRWPECHQPTWTNDLSQQEFMVALKNYLVTVVSRYEKNPTVESWQLENEALNEWFGKCGKPDRNLLRQEVDIVKNLSNKPLFMSLSDQWGYPLNAPIPDEFGFSIYPIVYDPRGFYINFATPTWYHRLRAMILTTVWHKPVFIHELQLEPWGPDDISKLSIDEQNKSMSIDQIHRNIRTARQIGVDSVYTWGSEWWYWRKEKLHDPSIWQAVQQEVNDSRN